MGGFGSPSKPIVSRCTLHQEDDKGQRANQSVICRLADNKESSVFYSYNSVY